MLSWLFRRFAKPREDDWNAATNRHVRFEPALFAQKQQRRFVVLLEMRDVGPVEINFSRAPRRGDFEFRQPARPVAEGDAGHAFCAARNRSASMAAAQPMPAAVMAWR